MQQVSRSARIIQFFSFVRGCVYYEAYVLEKKRGSDSLVLPAMLVGVFDSPVLFAIILLIESMISSGDTIRNIYPTGISDFYSLLYFLVVASIELLYFQVGKRGIKIIREFEQLCDKELARVRRVSLWYGFFTLVGGSFHIFLIL